MQMFFYLQIVLLFCLLWLPPLGKAVQLFRTRKLLPHGYSTNRKKVNEILQCFVHVHLLCITLDVMLFFQYPFTSILLLIAGDVEINPGPVSQTFKFCHWNLNIICAREK